MLIGNYICALREREGARQILLMHQYSLFTQWVFTKNLDYFCAGCVDKIFNSPAGVYVSNGGSAFSACSFVA